MTGPLVHIEQKYLFPAGGEMFILDWLEHSLVRDPEYASGMISTLYYDTPALVLYEEKRNGSFLKHKVRLRWYDDVDRHTEGKISCFLEIKRKEGAHCEKRRLPLTLPAQSLADPFADKTLLDLPARVPELDYTPPGILVPLLLIRYTRHRFVAPGSRIAVDSEIACTQANEGYFPVLPPIFLDVGVLETKGERPLPPELYPLQTRLTKSSFSKYAQCFERIV